MTTVGNTLTRVARDLHQKDNTFKLGAEAPYWNPDEMIGYVNYVEKDWFRQTGIKIFDISQAMPAGNTIGFTKPVGAMDIERLSFNKKRMRRQSTWDLTRQNPNWRNSAPGQPKYWHEDHLGVNNFEVNRRPVAGGAFRFFVTMVPTVHAAYPAGYAENLNVIDAWEPYIRWDVLALALGKDGDYQDVKRSGYCHQRYMLGVSLAKRLVQGSALPANPMATQAG
jgi:hypothetical protein